MTQTTITITVQMPGSVSSFTRETIRSQRWVCTSMEFSSKPGMGMESKATLRGFPPLPKKNKLKNPRVHK
jgi:hypothetical protein